MIEANATQVRKMVERALDGADRLPVRDQIDLHQAAAFAFQAVDPKASEDAAYIAQLHREGERLQLKFRELLRG